MSFYNEQLKFFRELDPDFRKNALYVFLCYFFLLLSYPSIRSVAQSLFYEHYDVADYSYANFLAVLVLSLLIALMNLARKFFSYRILFLFFGLLSLFALTLSYFALVEGIALAAFSLFIFKESYIVLLLHLCLASANANFSLDSIKRLYGPLGALGSFGGILGGQVTSSLSYEGSLLYPFGFGIASALFAILSFFSIRWNKKENESNEKQPKDVIRAQTRKSPIASLKTVRRYVFLIAAIVMLSQWVIYLSDLQFNMIFQRSFESKSERTQFLGQVYSWINIISLVVQVFFLPWLLVKVSSKKLFGSVPIIYLFTLGISLTLGPVYLFGAAFAFVVFKGCDYSLFNTVKEVMYYPLSREQKYGAKFVTDMFVYRAGKAAIALVMAQSFIHSFFDEPWRLALLQGAFMTLWLLALVWLFKEQKKMTFNMAEKL